MLRLKLRFNIVLLLHLEEDGCTLLEDSLSPNQLEVGQVEG